jgi:hypothetical protein
MAVGEGGHAPLKRGRCLEATFFKVAPRRAALIGPKETAPAAREALRPSGVSPPVCGTTHTIQKYTKRPPSLFISVLKATSGYWPVLAVRGLV